MTVDGAYPLVNVVQKACSAQEVKVFLQPLQGYETRYARNNRCPQQQRAEDSDDSTYVAKLQRTIEKLQVNSRT